MTAIAGATAGLKVLWETVSGSSKRVDSWTNKIANAEVRVTKWFAQKLPKGMQLGMGGVIESEEAVKRAEASQLRRRTQMARAELERGAVLGAGGEQAAESMSRERFDRLAATMKGQARLAAISGEQQRLGGVRNALSTRNEDTEVGQRALLDAQQEAAEYAAKLAQQRLDTEREIIGERRTMLKEEIRGEQEKLKATQTKIKAEKDALLSAQERFGQMNERDQQRVLAIGRKAKENPDALTRQERAELRNVGLDSTREIASRGDVAAAERAGFSTVFGGEERSRIDALQKQERQLEISVKDKRELVVQIDREEDELARRAAEAIAAELNERDAILVAKIQEMEGKAREQINSMTNEQVRQRAGVITRGR